MNYFVVAEGHIAHFDQYEAAVTFAGDFKGSVFNRSGLVFRDWPWREVDAKTGRILERKTPKLGAVPNTD